MKITTLYELEQFYRHAKDILSNHNSLYLISYEIEENNNRSIEQNECYWAFNSKLAEFFNLSGITFGYHKLPYTKERVHRINKSLFDVATTRDMSAQDFSAYMDQLNIFWSERTKGFFNF
ncbi:MAG: hypothetical protein IJ184_07355 [Alphaproteobacteria bacterium]|nr:hypothetical protein [Alphaproteobacteria bacterium]